VGQQVVIDVGSVTYAMKSRELLRNNGIRAYVERLPRTPNTSGCGYGVYVPNGVEEAEQILQEAGIHVLGRRERVQQK
jgi:hypothetical protein